MLDVRVSKTVALGGLGRVELLMDVLNAFNQATEEGLATDNAQATSASVIKTAPGGSGRCEADHGSQSFGSLILGECRGA